MVSAERAAALRKAVNVSAPGTIETCRRTLKRSAYGGRPEVVCARSKRRFDPDLTSNGCRTTSDRVGIPPRNGGNALGGFLRLVAEYVSYFALRTTDRRNYTVPVPPIAGARPAWSTLFCANSRTCGGTSIFNFGSIMAVSLRDGFVKLSHL